MDLSKRVGNFHQVTHSSVNRLVCLPRSKTGRINLRFPKSHCSSDVEIPPTPFHSGHSFLHHAFRTLTGIQQTTPEARETDKLTWSLKLFAESMVAEDGCHHRDQIDRTMQGWRALA
ncbi:hypothetical protein CC2G_009973 [Coprinopsis cinerea AmutBmut pab1-1]|nr:hypothetical protein CC2G_009973 [Coprinopsis cinerea AmutBmut pab1-1]